jgi:hypothetical protein
LVTSENMLKSIPKIFLVSVLVFICFGFFCDAPDAKAISIRNKLNETAVGAGLELEGWVDPTEGVSVEDGAIDTGNIMVSFINKIIFQIVPVLYTLLLLYGGLIWLTGGSDQGQVKKARGILIHSTLGVLVVYLSYLAVTWVLFFIQAAFTTT